PKIKAKPAAMASSTSRAEDFINDFDNYVVPFAYIALGLSSAISDFTSGKEILSDNNIEDEEGLGTMSVSQKKSDIIGNIDTILNVFFWSTNLAARIMDKDANWKHWTLAGLNLGGPTINIIGKVVALFPSDSEDNSDGDADENTAILGTKSPGTGNFYLNTNDIPLAIKSMLGLTRIGFAIDIAVDNHDPDGGLINCLGIGTQSLQFLNTEYCVTESDGLSMVVLGSLDLIFGIASGVGGFANNVTTETEEKDDDEADKS
ncbi:MAG: hypothetical protein AAF985_24555, partial [Bacteroidota bacterium]